MGSWDRGHFAPTDGRYLLHYVVPGRFEDMPPLSQAKYRSGGPRTGWELTCVTEAGALEEFTTGLRVAWNWLEAADSNLATRVRAAPMAMVMQAEGADEADLAYLRDAVGLVKYLLDCGGIAVRSSQTLTWHSASTWHDDFFAPNAAVASRHVVILTTPEPAGTVWMHTRGMRAFARPDISVRGVPAEQAALAESLVNRLIGFHAAGAWVPEGQQAFINELPTAMVCRHEGSLDDVEFNNFHLEMTWPADGIQRTW